MIVNIHAAKTHLSKLVDQAANGDELVAQAMAEPLHLYTADRQLSPYSELVVFIA